MIEWLKLTFAPPSEQAQLFSIVVSTILAIGLLLLNQWFNGLKSKHDLRISKIEELLIGVYSYERECLDILSGLFNSHRIQQSTLDKMAKSVELADRIEMLCALYFHNVLFKSESTQKILLKVHQQFDADETENNYPKSEYLTYKECTRELRSVINPLKAECRNLMKPHI